MSIEEETVLRFLAEKWVSKTGFKYKSYSLEEIEQILDITPILLEIEDRFVAKTDYLNAIEEAYIEGYKEAWRKAEAERDEDMLKGLKETE